MKIKNMTPHEIKIVGEYGDIKKTFSSEGQIRLSQETKIVNTFFIDGVEIPLSIVSSLVCQALHQDSFEFDDVVEFEEHIASLLEIARQEKNKGDMRWLKTWNNSKNPGIKKE